MAAPPPVDPRRDHVRGPDGAPVLLIYGDYEDPFTRTAWRTAEGLGVPVRLAFRHLPGGSAAAAVAAEAAAALAAFWPMHEALLAHDGAFGAEAIRRCAAEAGLDPARFEAVFGSDAQMARIREDVLGAAEAGVTGAPALFLDGERLDGYEAGWLRERIATR